MGECAVVREGLTRRFGKVVAVDHLDFRVKARELYGFLGPNGAGKSTTLRMLCGLLDPSEGTGTVLGIDLRREPERIKAVIGYMSQQYSLYDDLTAEENLTFYSRVYMVPRAERQQRIAQMVRLADLTGQEKKRTSFLSGGYRQRLALACAIVHRPRLVFLDEPTAGIDPVSRRNFWGLVRRLVEEGVTVVLTTHYLDEAELCDTLGFMYQGRLVAHGFPADIRKTAFRKSVIEVEVNDPRRALDLLEGWPVVEETIRVGTKLRLILADEEATPEAVRRHLKAYGLAVVWAHEAEPTMEDLFVSFVDAERKGG
jgi:ABC-2 type transport system ATP-binding protein